MLQVIKKEFNKLDDLICYINDISIRYGHLKDYELLKEENIYILLMNFDVPETKLILELARLRRGRNENEPTYIIEIEGKCRSAFLNLSFINLKSGLLIKGGFGIKEDFQLIEINYDEIELFFKIELYDFEFIKTMKCWSIGIIDTLLVKEVDYKIIYNHIVKLMFNRGYLLNYSSLQDLEESIYYKVNWLNNKKFI